MSPAVDNTQVPSKLTLRESWSVVSHKKSPLQKQEIENVSVNLASSNNERKSAPQVVNGKLENKNKLKLIKKAAKNNQKLTRANLSISDKNEIKHKPVFKRKKQKSIPKTLDMADMEKPKTTSKLKNLNKATTAHTVGKGTVLNHSLKKLPTLNMPKYCPGEIVCLMDSNVKETKTSDGIAIEVTACKDNAATDVSVRKPKPNKKSGRKLRALPKQKAQARQLIPVSQGVIKSNNKKKKASMKSSAIVQVKKELTELTAQTATASTNQAVKATVKKPQAKKRSPYTKRTAQTK